MRLIPSRKVCEEFNLTYEFKGAQKAVDVLARYYGIRRMKIVLDGRKVGNNDEACYEKYVAYFKKKRLNKRNVLHEFYHHLAYVYEWDMTESREEREANRYARIVFARDNYTRPTSLENHSRPNRAHNHIRTIIQ